MFKKNILLLIGSIAASLNVYATQYTSLAVYKPLYFSSIEGSVQNLLLQYDWKLSNQKHCSDFVDTSKCYTGTFDMYPLTKDYSQHPDLLSGRVLRVQDAEFNSVFGVIYDVTLMPDTGTATFSLVLDNKDQDFDKNNIAYIEVVSNTNPQNPSDYMIKPTFLKSLPNSGLYLSRFPLTYPNQDKNFISYWGSDFLQTGSEIDNKPLLQSKTTCGELISGQSNVHCARARLRITNDVPYFSNPEALLGRQIDLVAKYPDKGMQHFIPYDFEPVAGKPQEYYFYGQMDEASYPAIKFPMVEATPKDIHLEQTYVSYGRDKLGIGQIEKSLPLNVEVSKDPAVERILSLDLTMDFSKPHTFISKQDWFSPNLGFSASSFIFSSLQFDEVIEVPANSLGIYQDSLQLLNGRALVSTDNNVYAVVYDSYSYVDYSGESQLKVVDLYVKSRSDISDHTSGPLTLTLEKNSYPQNPSLFYWNPLGGFIPYESRADAGISPLNSQKTQLQEERDSKTAHKWTSKAGDRLTTVPNQCPVYSTIGDSLDPYGCTELLIDEASYAKLEKDSVPVSDLKADPTDPTAVPYTLVELVYHADTSQYVSNGNYFYVYDVGTKGKDHIFYVARYQYKEFSARLLNDVIPLHDDLTKKPYMYGLIKGAQTYLSVTNPDSKKSLKGTKTKQKKVKAKL